MMENKKRLIDANEIEELFYKQIEYGATDLKNAFDDALQYAPTVDAVTLSDLEAWLYEIAMNNVGVMDDGNFSDHVEEIIKRMDGLREFSEERRTDGRNAAD